MCYLRNFTPIQSTFNPKDQLIVSPEENFEELDYQQKNSNVDFEFFGKQSLNNIFTQNQNSFKGLLEMAQKNSLALQNLAMKIQQNDCLLDEFSDDEEPSKVSEVMEESQVETEQSTAQQENSFKTEQFLTKKLFGENKYYKYKLVLEDDFPQQVFKQRNFGFKVKLTDQNGRPIRNSNIIHLCLGVCDVKGQWITETKSKQPLMKGKTESQLYHGEASYSKIYSRDVSRHYLDGKMNIVIYPKESVLKYCQGSTFLDEAVTSQDIEPLVIKDLVIKAKKKE